MKIIANMIVRNEADRYLTQVLDRLSACVDEIVVTDDGSDDNSFEIARSYGHAMRRGDSVFEENESSIRKASWEHLSHYAKRGDWILSIDADEMIYGLDKSARVFLEASNFKVAFVTFYHMWNNYEYRVDKAWRPDRQPRLFEYHPEGTYADRKLAGGQYPTYVKQMVRDRKAVDIGLAIAHLGYMSDEDKIAKHEKYMRIDGGRFHSLAHLESIIDKDVTLRPWSDLGNVF